jgi:hypothetical protein
MPACLRSVHSQCAGSADMHGIENVFQSPIIFWLYNQHQQL